MIITSDRSALDAALAVHERMAEFMDNLACDMLSAEDGNEDPSQEQVDEAKQRAIDSGYLMNIAREQFTFQFD